MRTMLVKALSLRHFREHVACCCDTTNCFLGVSSSAAAYITHDNNDASECVSVGSEEEEKHDSLHCASAPRSRRDEGMATPGA